MKKILLTLTVALAALMLTQCKKNVEQIENNAINGGLTGETIEVSLTAGTGGEKTDIDGLTVQWLAGDKIYVAGSEDGYLGYLTAQEGGNPVEFKGLIRKTTTSQTYYFYYVGDNEFALGGTNNDEFTFSVEEQYGILSDDANSIANRFQLAKGSKAVEGTPGHDLGNVTLNSMMAISRLNLQVSGTSMGGASTDIVTVSGAGCYSTGTLNIKTGNLGAVAGSVVLNNASDDYYMAIIPANQTAEGSALSLTYTATSMGWECVSITPTVAANKFYNHAGAVAVNMETATSTGNGTSGQLGGDDWNDDADWIDFNDAAMGVTGLPVWSKYNIGVDKTNLDEASDWYGKYYAWGEVRGNGEPMYGYPGGWTGSTNTNYVHGNIKSIFEWQYFKWGSSPTNVYKYTPTDGRTVLEPEDDAATFNLGGGWRMPTGGDSYSSDWNMLIMNTYSRWVTNYMGISGLNGYVVFKVKNADHKMYVTKDDGTTYNGAAVVSGFDPSQYNLDDPHMFLPAAGTFYGSSIDFDGSSGYYWASNLDSNHTNMPGHLYVSGTEFIQKSDRWRVVGHSVRPVR